jgi:Zn-dependent peptidase ImmA (M78 family)
MPVVRRKYIRELVGELLKANRIRSAPIDVEAIAKRLGIEIRRELAPDDLSGFILRDKQLNRPVIGVNRGHHPRRQRFTIAHEIGHFMLHKGEQLHVDRINAGFVVRRRDGRSKEGTDVEEKEANLFAAELLMPSRFIKRDITEVGFSLMDECAIRELAEQYQVSTAALTFRLAHLGYIELSDGEAS